MAPTAGRFTMPDRRWDCRRGSPIANWVPVEGYTFQCRVWTPAFP